MLRYLSKLRFKKLCYLYLILHCCIWYFMFEDIKMALFFNRESDDGIPVLVWWTPMINKDKIIHCPSNKSYKCLLTKNRTHDSNTNLGAYLFNGTAIVNNDFPLPRNKMIPWAILHDETAKKYSPYSFEKVCSLFNITSTYSRHSDLPLTLKHLTDVSRITDTMYYIPLDIKNKHLNVVSPVLYIESNCDTLSGRDNLVKELGKYVGIDCYGKCLRNKTFPKRIADIYSKGMNYREMFRFISKYKFIIAIEDAICDDYITETLWRPLTVGCIPIYFGSPTIEDWLPNNNSAILVKNYKSMKAVGDFIKTINENDEMYESFLEHKIDSKVSNPALEKYILHDSPIASFENFVCESVHKHIYSYKQKNLYTCPKPKVLDKETTWNQHWEIGKCQSKALKLLIGRDKPYSIKLFDMYWKTFLKYHTC